jgi:hypothetical protein
MATETQGEVIRSGSKRVPGLGIKLQAIACPQSLKMYPSVWFLA